MNKHEREVMCKALEVLKFYAKHYANGNAAIAAIEKCLANDADVPTERVDGEPVTLPEQEPVPKPNEGFEGSIRVYIKRINNQWERLETIEQANAFTRQRLASKPLTDEEIDALWLQHDFIRAPDRKRQAFARAIEAAHGIKGES